MMVRDLSRRSGEHGICGGVDRNAPEKHSNLRVRIAVQTGLNEFSEVGLEAMVSAGIVPGQLVSDSALLDSLFTIYFQKMLMMSSLTRIRPFSNHTPGAATPKLYVPRALQPIITHCK